MKSKDSEGAMTTFPRDARVEARKKRREAMMMEAKLRETKKEKMKQMLFEESDSDDVDYIGEATYIDNDAEEELDSDVGDDGDDFGNDGDDEENEVKKRKRKGKAVESESEDEEEIFTRFELEVEEEMTKFVDDLSKGRREISESEDENPAGFQNSRGTCGNLMVGRSFLTRDDFKEAILDYALSSGYNIAQGKSEPRKISFKCGIGGTCKWRIYCSFDEARQMWLVKSTYRYHNCTPNGKCRYLQSPRIAKIFMDKLRLNPQLMPAKIQEHIKDQWKFVTTRSVCQDARLKALAAIEKEYIAQFAHIRGYAEEILNSNPGSTVVIHTMPNDAGQDVFQGIYICFDIIQKNWRGSCRPIIGLDGIFLKVATKGCLLAAVGHDGNNQIYPIAWAVVQSETADNWLWFMKLLKDDFFLKDGSGYVIISDRGKGLLAAVKKELPNAEHRMCVKHIVENLKNRGHAGKDLLKPLIWSLAWSYTTTDYEENLKKIYAYDIGLYNEVMKEKPETWSLAFYKLGSFCEDVDNNSTESFNATITKARAKTLIPMLETIRRQVMERITKRHLKSVKRQEMFTKYVVKILAEEKKDAERCKTYACTHGTFEIFLYGNSYRVNLPRASCTCGKWQISGIPCEHAYGAMLDTGVDVEQHVSRMFSTAMWQTTYDSSINPMRGPRFWMTNNYGLVTPPQPPAMPGRRKETKRQKVLPRIKGKNESPKKKSKKDTETLSQRNRIMHCRSCGEAGHNAAGCRKFPKEKKNRNTNTLKVGSSSEQTPISLLSHNHHKQAVQMWLRIRH